MAARRFRRTLGVKRRFMVGDDDVRGFIRRMAGARDQPIHRRLRLGGGGEKRARVGSNERKPIRNIRGVVLKMIGTQTRHGADDRCAAFSDIS
jgi:hypothetical protein